MIAVSRLALGPLLLVQGRRVRRTALRLPEPAGPREGVEGGADVAGLASTAGVTPVGRGAAGGPPLRLLVVGDSSAAGVGVDFHHQAVAQPAAVALAARTGRSVAWRLVARSGIDTVEAHRLVAEAAPGPADVAVFALGVNDVTAQRVGAPFVAAYAALVAEVVARTGARHLLVNGVPPMHVLPALPEPLRWYLGRCARVNDGLLAAWARARDDCAFLPLDWAARADDLAHDGFHPGPAQYLHWAGLIAERLAAQLAAERQAPAAAAR